jgi:hypothetical protein
MNIFTRESLTAASYVFVVVAGIIALSGAIIVYLDRKTRYSKKRKGKIK